MTIRFETKTGTLIAKNVLDFRSIYERTYQITTVMGKSRIDDVWSFEVTA
jgi:hypothetical protein